MLLKQPRTEKENLENRREWPRGPEKPNLWGREDCTSCDLTKEGSNWRLWPGSRSRARGHFPSHCPPFHPSPARLVPSFGQTHLEAKGPGNPLMEVFKNQMGRYPDHTPEISL